MEAYETINKKDARNNSSNDSNQRDSQVWSPLVKSKPVIKRIIIDKDKLQDLQDILKNPHVGTDAKSASIKRIAGGFCSLCGGIPTIIVNYNKNGANLIEKYCDTCFKKLHLLNY
jgi:hypothetical protein